MLPHKKNNNLLFFCLVFKLYFRLLFIQCQGLQPLQEKLLMSDRPNFFREAKAHTQKLILASHSIEFDDI